MIRTQTEYKEMRKRIEQAQARLVEVKKELRKEGLSEDEINRVLAPGCVFLKQDEQEVARYELMKHGDLTMFGKLRELGLLLVGARIARGWHQSRLAEKLDVNQSQVSRDERNDYRGVTLERACQILEALGVEVVIRAKLRVGDGDAVPPPPTGTANILAVLCGTAAPVSTLGSSGLRFSFMHSAHPAEGESTPPQVEVRNAMVGLIPSSL
jgi:transcriptional regulator with XRE-family HTH domain